MKTMLKAGFVAVLGSSLWTTAEATPLECVKTADQSVVAGDAPATVNFTVTVRATEPTGGTAIGTLQDSLEGTLLPINFSAAFEQYYDSDDQLQPGAMVWNQPVALPPVHNAVITSSVTLDYATCKALGVLQPDQSVVMTTTTTGTNFYTPSNVFSCSAAIVCEPPFQGTGATRTIGFYKTHVETLSRCLESAPVNLGFAQIATVDQALALLWASPGPFSGVDRARILLGRQTLVASCSQRLFGASPSPSNLVSQAVGALGAQNCSAMNELSGLVDAFNNENTEVAFPASFVPGPSYGKAAEKMAGSIPGMTGAACQ